MLKRVWFLALALNCLSPLYAETKPSDSVPEANSASKLSAVGGAGINLLSYPGGISNVANRMPFAGTLTANYFFGDVVGAFSGLQATTRGFKTMVTGTSSSALFVDVPFGVVINASGDLQSNVRPLIRVGGFYAIPTASDFTGDASLSNIGTKTKSYFGLYLDHQTTFPITKQFAFGYTVWGKLPLSSGLDPTEANFYEAGVGIVIEMR